MKLYKATQFAKEIGVHVRTLYNWENNGTLLPYKKVNKHRYYSEDQLHKYLQTTKEEKPRKNVGYARVSSHNQKEDLESQVVSLETYLTTKGVPFEILTDIGSGLNYKKKGLNTLIDMIMNNEIDTVVVTYADRLVRFGSELIEIIMDKHETRLEVINQSEFKTGEEELVEDMIRLVTVLSGRLHGKRKGKTKRMLEELKLDESDI